MTSQDQSLHRLKALGEDFGRICMAMQSEADRLKSVRGLERHAELIDRSLVDIRRPASAIFDEISRIEVLPRPMALTQTSHVEISFPVVRKRKRMTRAEYDRQYDTVALYLKKMVPGQTFKATTFAGNIAKRSSMTSADVVARLRSKDLQRDLRYRPSASTRGFYEMLK